MSFIEGKSSRETSEEFLRQRAGEIHNDLNPHANVSEFIKEQLNTPGVAAYFEVELSRLNLLSQLEQTGILPVLANPNPFDPEIEEDRHTKWWEEHPMDAERFTLECEERDRLIKLMYVGFIIGHFRGDDMFGPK